MRHKYKILMQQKYPCLYFNPLFDYENERAYDLLCHLLEESEKSSVVDTTVENLQDHTFCSLRTLKRSLEQLVLSDLVSVTRHSDALYIDFRSGDTSFPAKAKKLQPKEIQLLCDKMDSFILNAKEVVIKRRYKDWRIPFDYFCCHKLFISPDLKTFDFEYKSFNLEKELTKWFFKTFPYNQSQSRQILFGDNIDKFTKIKFCKNFFCELDIEGVSLFSPD